MGIVGDHVMSWFLMRQTDPGFILLRYEDMKADPVGQLERIASFLQGCAFPGMDCSPERLKTTVELSAPERMRSLERQRGCRWLRLHNERAIQGYVAVRVASAGGWKSAL
jgi:hypothetical protein